MVGREWLVAVMAKVSWLGLAVLFSLHGAERSAEPR